MQGVGARHDAALPVFISIVRSAGRPVMLVIETSSGASGGCLPGCASFKLEKAHFAARKKGLENRKNEVKLRFLSLPPPEALYESL